MKKTVLKAVLAFTTIAIASAHGAEPLPTGTWYGGDTAAMSIYGYFVITDRLITWGDPSPRRKYAFCSKGYRVVDEPVGTKYRDQVQREHTVGENDAFRTFRVAFTDQNCAPDLSGFRISFDKRYEDLLQLHLIEYDKSGNPLGYMHFDKLSDRQAAEIQPVLEEHLRTEASRR